MTGRDDVAEQRHNPIDQGKTMILSEREINECLAKHQDDRHEKADEAQPRGRKELHQVETKDKFSITLSNDDPEHAEARLNLYHSLGFNDGEMLRQEVEKYLSQPVQEWVIDMTQLIYCDSATLGFCVMIYTIVKRFCSRMHIRVLRDSQAHELLVISKLEKIIPIVTA
jgi:anti-anti-sigma regulatory factor